MKGMRVSKGRVLGRLVLAVLLAWPAGQALAMDTFLVGPRAMGMGGANIASTSDTTAQYYNPAAFGFFDCRDEKGGKIACDNTNLGRKKWGMDLNAGIGYRLHNEFGSFVDELADIDLDLLSTEGIQDESDLADLVNLLKNLNGLDDPGNAITASANAGLAARYGHWAVGVRGFSQAAGRVLELDRTNLGIAKTDINLNNEINAVTVVGGDQPVQLFTQAQQDQLALAGLDAAAIQKLDAIARNEGITQNELGGTVDLLAELATQTITGTGGDLADNTTTVRLSGLGLGEVPISYGYAINDHWSVGGNLKLMMGRVYGNEVVVFDDNSGDIIAQTDENFEETYNFGIDLGVMGRYNMVNFGLVARNINAPKFDGPTTAQGVKFDDVKVDPQLAAGVAFIPFETLILEVDLDLTENETALADYKTRNLSFGLEWDAFRILALRAGAFKNLAEDDIGVVYTAGLGVNLWAARLDLAAAFAGETEEFDGNDIPKEIQVAGQLSIDF